MKLPDKTHAVFNRIVFSFLHAAVIMLLAIYGIMLFLDAPSWDGIMSFFKALFITYQPLSYRILTGPGAVTVWCLLFLYGILSLVKTRLASEQSPHSALKQAGESSAIIISGIILLTLFFFAENRIAVQMLSLLGLAGGVFSYTAFIKTSPERTRAAADFIISIFFGFVLFITANVYAHRTNGISDVSSSQFYSLTEPTVKMLENLDRKIKIYVILQPSPIRRGQIYDYTKKLFGQIENRSENVTVEYVPPRSGKAETLVKKYNIRADEALIFESGEKSKAITVDPSGDPLAVFEQESTHHGRMNRSIREIKAFKGEHILFLTINELVSERKKEILFIEGHGERSITEYGDQHLTELYKELSKLNYTVLTKRLRQGEIPVADALVVAGPTTSFLDWEIEILRRYLKESNGSLLYFSEPILKDTWIEEAGLTPLLKDYGIQLHDAIAMIYSRKYRGFLDQMKSNLYEIHPITAGFDNEEIFLQTPRPISETDISEPTMKSTLLISKSGGFDEELWGETKFGRKIRSIGRDEKDIMAPIGLAAAAGPKKVGGTYFKTPRIVVFGDVDIMVNRNFNKLNNSTFIMNCFNWTLEEEQIEKIPPKDFELIKVDVSDDVMNGIFNLIVLSLPGFFLLFGVIVLIRRKS